MKSSEVYTLLRAEMAPTLKAAGFVRQKAFLSWSRPSGRSNTVVWCQVSQDGWDPYSGSKFVVEFQRSSEPEPGTPAESRRRLAKLLNSQQAEQVRATQNQVIASLQRPPANYAALRVSPEITRSYLGRFEKAARPYAPGEDIWLRYGEPAHVKAWATLLVEFMPSLLAAFESGT
jgi:hypothetical protein